MELDSQTPDVGVEADDGGRGRHLSLQVPPPTPTHTHTPTPRQPRRDRAVSCRKRRRAVPSATHCLPARGPYVPPPNTVSVSPPTPRSRVRDWNQVPKLSRSDAGEVPESVGALQGEQAPHLAPKGGRRAISRVQSPQLCSPPTWGSQCGRGPSQRTSSPPHHRALSPQKGRRRSTPSRYVH